MPSTSPSTTTSRPHVQRRTVVRRSLTLAGLAVFGLPGLAFAQTPAATGSWIGPFAVIAAGIGMAIAAGLCGLGQGRAVASAVDAIARQPGAARRRRPACSSDVTTLRLPPSEDPRDDDPSSFGLHPVSAAARRGRDQDRVLAGARRAVQPQLGAGAQGPRLLRRVRRPGHRLLRVRPEGGAPADPRTRS